MWAVIGEFMVMLMIFPSEEKVLNNCQLSLSPVGRQGLQPLVSDLCYLHSLLPVCKQDPNDLIERIESCISSSFSQASGNDEGNVRSGMRLFNDFLAEIKRQHIIQLSSLPNTAQRTSGVAFILAAATIITEASNDTVSRFKKKSKVCNGILPL